MNMASNNNKKIHTFSNSLVLITEPLLNYSTASIAFYLCTGSRDESNNTAGFSHFIEHMMFKGCPLGSKLTIAETFDRLGAQINAYTSKEEVVLYNTVPTVNFEEAFNLMLSMFNESYIDLSEIILEKDVILNEMNLSEEDPQDKITEDFFTGIFPDSGLGRPIIGFEKNIHAANANVLKEYYMKMFTADNLIISIAGNFSTDFVTDTISKTNFRRSIRTIDHTARITSSNSGFTKKDTELVHVLSGTVLYTNTPESYFHLNLCNMVIGGSMSSRLFQIVRDNNGLCYSINSDIDKFRNEIVFSINYSVTENKLARTSDLVSNEIYNLQRNGITDIELDKAKKHMLSQMILSSDILHKRLSSSIYYYVYYNNTITKDDAIRIINTTDISTINKLLTDIFTSHFYTHILYKKKLKEKLWKI